jgi:hypothetical protein
MPVLASRCGWFGEGGYDPLPGALEPGGALVRVRDSH